MNFSVTDSSPSCIHYRNKANYGALSMADSSKFNFTHVLRMIQEIDRAAKAQSNSQVNWLTMNHMQVLLHIFDMETPEGLEAQTLAKITGHNKSTVNRIVHSLAEGGGRGAGSKDGLNIIEMVTDVSDRRIRRIHITPFGKRLKKLLLEAGGPDDEEAQLIQMAMQGHMYESTANVDRSNVLHMKADNVVTAEAKVGEATIKQNHSLKAEVGTVKVVTNDAEMGPTTLHPQGMVQLERALRYAAKNDLWHVSYRGVEVPLIDVGKARKLVEKGKLYRGNSLGVWTYHDNPVGDDYAATPAFIQADLTEDELTKYADNMYNKIVHGKGRVDITLDDVGKTLNNHQRKYVVTYITNALSHRRAQVLNDAEKSLDIADDQSKKVQDLLKEGEVVLETMATTDDPVVEQNMYQRASMLHQQADQRSRTADSALQDATSKRQLAQTIAQMQEELVRMQKQLDEEE